MFVQDFSPSGNFRGVIDGLDRIQSAGADVLWLMPIYPIGVLNRKGTLGSPYAVRDYRGFNPAYGNAADFRALVRGGACARDEAHPRLGAEPHLAGPSLGQGASRLLRPERAGRAERAARREGEADRLDRRGAARLQESGGAARDDRHHAVLAEGVRHRRLPGRCRRLHPLSTSGARRSRPLRAAVPRRILLLAEWGDLEMHRLGFDLTYAWDSYDRLKAVWQGAPASSFVQARAAGHEGHARRAACACASRTNHDKTAWEDPPVTIFGRGAGARAAFVAVALLPGRPLLYNGQEVESPQKLGLFEREPIVWDQPGAAEARAFYAAVLKLARTEPALVGRDLRPVETSAPKDVIAYRRGDLVVLVNAEAQAGALLRDGLRGRWLARSPVE